MSRHFDVIVIGVGAMGAATCFYLAQRGIRTLGLEQFDIAHARGSSHGSSRMIRKAYFEDPGYVPLLHRAYALWDELEAASGQRLLHRVGGVFIGPADGTLVAGAMTAATMHKLYHELVDGDEMRRRWPQFAVPEDWSAFYEPDSGFLLPEKAIGTYAQLALRHGAEIRAQEPVRDWSADGAGYVVRTDRDTYTASRLIFCGGAWSGKLLGDLGVKLKVTRQVLAWVWPKNDPQKFELGTMPVWGVDSLDGGLYYGFPMMKDLPGLKFAHHLANDEAFDPDTISREPLPSDRIALEKVLAKHLPDANGTLLTLKTCLYTNTPDGHFVIDRHPAHPNVYVACGFSGHGFKFASVIGESLANAAATGGLDPSFNFLRSNRFM